MSGPRGVFGYRFRPGGRVSAWPPGEAPTVHAEIYRSADKSIARLTDTAIDFDAEQEDAWGFHSITVNPTRLTVPAGLDGVYVVAAHLTWGSNTNGVLRAMWVLLNGAYVVVEPSPAPVTVLDTDHAASTVLRLAAGDYLELHCFHDVAGGLSVKSYARRSPVLRVGRLGL